MFRLRNALPVLATLSALTIGIAAPSVIAQDEGCGWQATLSDGPGERSGMETIYDSARHRVVLFGGYKGEWPNGEWPTDLWAWDGTEWSRLHDGSGLTPEGRQSFCMVYDSHRDDIIIFGNSGYGGFDPRTWAWDSNTGLWSIVEDGTDGPTPRGSASMMFDASLGEAVLFGGTPDNNSLLGDTWVWSSDTQSWKREFPPTSPTARDNSAMVYDIRAGVGVLFGGFDSPPDHGASSRRNDTWNWDGLTRTWTEVHSGGGSNAPGNRNGHALAFDTARGVTVLFGGWNGEGLNYPETWEWDGAAWKQRAAFGPEGRTHHAMVYDMAHGNTVVFGGGDHLGNRFPETWTWSGAIRGDYNGDGVRDTRDVLAFLNDWTAGCP